MRTLRSIVALAIASPGLFAQCETAWQLLESEQSVAGKISSLARWDPDGAGPQPEQLIVGGQFSMVGSLAIANLALFDPASQTWSAIGGGTDGEVVAIERQPNGGLVIAGTFTQVNGVAAAGLAAWDGTTWSSLPGAAGTVRTLCHDISGNLIVGGLFSAVGGVTAQNVAVWNGSNWSAMGAGLAAGAFAANPGVHDLSVLTNGVLVAVGALSDPVATWDGASWTGLPTPPGQAHQLTEVAAEPSGSLLCAGTVSGSSSVVRWDGTSWSQLGNLGQGVSDVEVMPNGDIIACRNYSASGIYRWSGAAWITLGSYSILSGQTFALQSFPGTQPGQFFVGGTTDNIGSAFGSSLFFFDGNTFNGDDVSPNGLVRSMVAFPNGENYVLGDFTRIGGVNAPRIARWGTSWQAVGNGLPISANTVGKLANGDLVVPTMLGVYRFDGSTWQLMPGSNFEDQATVLLRPNGDLLVGGRFALRRFDGSTWTQIPGVNNVLDMENLPNGNVALTGKFFSSFPGINDHIAEWDGGSSWTALDPSSSLVHPHDLVVMRNGDLAVADPSQLGVRVFDGTNWSQLGALTGGVVTSLQKNAANELFAGGSFTADGTTPCLRVARWTGTSWSAIAGGSPANTVIIAPTANGDVLSLLYVLFNNFIASHRTACPASAVSYSPACAGAAGTSELKVRRLPLLGASYEARAIGLSNNVFVFDLYGLQAVNLPLSSLLQPALPGCVLAVDPIEVRLQSAQSSFTSSFAIPPQQSLVGFGMRHQMLLLDVGSLGNLLAASATNAILVTLGSPQ